MTADLQAPLAGVLPVIMTPFSEDWTIDAGALAAELDWLFENGADGVTVAMVSEIQRLSHAERAELTRVTVNLAAGRGPVVASVGAESTSTAVDLARQADADGASALMAAPPLLSDGALPEKELAQYLGAIAAVSSLPLVLQDASSYVGAPIPVATQAALVASFGPDRLLLKPEAAPIGPTCSALMDATGGTARIFDGSGGIALMDTYLRGLTGTMPGPDLTWAIRALWNALAAGDESTALAITRSLSTMMSMVPGLDGYVAFSKHLLVKQGVVPSDRMRHPVGFCLDGVTERLIDAHFANLLEMVQVSTS